MALLCGSVLFTGLLIQSYTALRGYASTLGTRRLLPARGNMAGYLWGVTPYSYHSLDNKGAARAAPIYVDAVLLIY